MRRRNRRRVLSRFLSSVRTALRSFDLPAITRPAIASRGPSYLESANEDQCTADTAAGFLLAAVILNEEGPARGGPPPAASHPPNANKPAMQTTAIAIRLLIMVNVSSLTLNIPHLIET